MKPFWRMILALGALVGAASPLMAQSGVTIEVDQFGVGNAFRPGELCAVRLKLTSHLSEPTPVWVQWQVPNVDGDIGECGRSLTLTPNQPALTWVYAPLPPETGPASVWTVRVFEERDGKLQGEVGGSRISPTGPPPVDLGTNMIAVIGQSRMGLDGYSNPTPGASRMPRPVGAHEDTRVVSGIRPSQLPDRWYGLWPAYEALAWSGDDSPQDMGVDQAEAVREYVRRGGHLIISLPNAGKAWGLGVMGQTEIEDLLPCRTPGQLPRRDEAVPLADLLPVISKYSTVTGVVGSRKPPEFTLRVFKDLKPAANSDDSGGFNVIDNHYEPLVALPDGRVFVIQRQYGFGRITVIGLDLSEMRGLPFPQADAFWNRILGRRTDTPTAGELKLIADAERLGRPEQNHENALGSGPLITGVINMEGKAGQGLLLALLLFAVYWLLAGPGGFALLKNYGRVQHSWLAFAACSAIFTAVAWGGVNLFPKRAQISHVTFLDHVARTPDDPRPDEPQYQRAVSYFSAYVPEYGDVPISIDSTPDQRDVLLSWSPPGVPTQKFPDVDRYQVDTARGLAKYSIPARSTATQLYASWMGGLDRNWGGTLRVDNNDPIVVDANEQMIRGKIINELPGTLRNVTVIWVKNNRLTRPRYILNAGKEEPFVVFPGGTLNSADMWRRPALPEWTAGSPFDLSSLTPDKNRQSLANGIAERYLKPYAEQNFTGTATGATIGPSDRNNYLEMLSLFQQLPPPEYQKSSKEEEWKAKVAFHRELGRELDLSAWFNRPCLIVIGMLENTPSPIPFRINDEGNLPIDKSMTVVRWVYPLPLNERLAFPEVFESPN